MRQISISTLAGKSGRADDQPIDECIAWRTIMVSKLVLFADGTGNSSRRSEKTNIWRICEALDQSDPRQLCIYSDGVGTSSNRILAAIGLATGWGVKKNVLALYKVVCRNYANHAPGSIGRMARADRAAVYSVR